MFKITNTNLANIALTLLLIVSLCLVDKTSSSASLMPLPHQTPGGGDLMDDIITNGDEDSRRAQHEKCTWVKQADPGYHNYQASTVEEESDSSYRLARESEVIFEQPLCDMRKIVKKDKYQKQRYDVDLQRFQTRKAYRLAMKQNNDYPVGIPQQYGYPYASFTSC